MAVCARLADGATFTGMRAASQRTRVHLGAVRQECGVRVRLPECLRSRKRGCRGGRGEGRIRSGNWAGIRERPKG